MLYSDKDIKKLIELDVIDIDPLPDLSVALGSCSIDLRLEGLIIPAWQSEKEIANTAYAFAITSDQALAYLQENPHYKVIRDITIPPHGFVLATTLETVTLPNHIVGHLHGRSSIARVGVGVHITAGIIDAGWSGKIVLELVNHSNVPVTLQHSQRVCALTFEALSSPTTRPYNQRENAKYKGQNGVVGSRLEQDKE